ncbi:hypothetical protein QYZ87_06745 [Porphyromonadaceae bacterium W3.11]|nr:hypothetical protein [Porphyromonadaceae bacterium W3.11]
MITIYNAQGTKIIDVANLEGSYCDRSIMGGSTLQLVVKSDKPIDIPLNSYVEYEARRYTLLYPASIKKQHSKEFDYTLLFHGEEELLSSCLIKDISGGIPYRVKFAITAKPIDFVRCIVDSLNEHYGGGWSVGNVIEATEQTLAFSHEYCLGAISRVAEVFNTEFSVDNKTVSLGKVSIMEDNPLPMSYGNGKGFRPGTGRHNDGKKSAIGKLYVEGGTRNIDYSTYGAQTLLLPKSATLQYNGRTYHTDAHGMYITCDQAIGTAEDSYDGSAVYPMREGTVSEVIEEADGYDFTDTSIPESLNFNDYRIKGEKAVVVFQTGALTGREFALVQTKGKLSGYIHSERKFKLVSEEQDGFMMPGGNFVPKEGDKYAIFNITLPAEYLSNASQRLFEEAVRYFDTVINPPYIFSGEVDPIWAKKEWLRIGGYMQPGGHLLFSDPQYHPEGSVIRVTGVRTLLDKPYAPQLTLSNAPAALSVSNALSKLEADKVIAERERRAQQRSQRQDYQQALEFIGMVEKAIEGLEGFTARIKPSVVETMAILIGSQATQFGFVQAINSLEAAPFSVNYDPSTKRVIISKGIIRHQTIGITDMTANRPATDYRYWSIPEYISPALTDDFASYYIYAKVDRDGEIGNYLLSEKPIEMESNPQSYHLLIGTLSSIVDGDRAYNKLYGYSLFTPGQMVLNTISSTNGAMTINLETGEIFSDSISFRRPDSGTKTNIIDYIDELDEHQAIIKDGTWWRWDGEKYVDTGEVAKGDSGPRGLQGVQGPQGVQGIPGAKGADGKTSYTHIAYADNASGGGFSQDPAGKAYIGMYVDFVQEDSSDHKKYKWSLIKGADGRNGTPGKAGADGRTPYLHIAYANSSDGRQGFSVSDSQGKSYIGQYTDYNQADSTDPTQYKWTLIKGRDGRDGKDGKDGLQGLQGKDGKDGLPGRDGKDGKTQYTHIAYANNASGGGFSQSPTGKAYIGMYVDFVATDSSDPKKYKWSLIKGADGRDGIAGKAGKDGRTPYLHIAYANSSDGRQGFSVSDSQGKTYIGTYTDFVKADSTDPSKYKWSLIKGDKGDKGDSGPRGLQGVQGPQGVQGIPGAKGADGKTSYTHIAYADNASGGGFSQDPAGKAYIGMYVDFVQEDSSDHKKYKWSLIKGADGRNGTPGKAGADGRTPYLHIAYATSADGKKGFSTTVSAGKTYIGTYTDFVKADSTTPSDYKWTLIKGEKGDRGPTGPKGDGLDVKDTRNDNQLPNWYRENYRLTTVKEFKFQGVIEIPKVWRDGSYCTLETTVNWGDKSGGRVTQKATLNSGQELYRVGGADDSAWGEWSNLKAEVQEMNAGLSNANTLISSIETITKQLKEGKLDASKFDDIRYLTDALQHGETTIAGGLLLTKSILMSNVSGGITTAISGYNEGGGVAFEAGIKNYKQENHTSRVVINHDGTARFGDMYVNTEDEDVVKFIDQSSGKNHEYLKFGGTAPSESYMNDQSTEIKEFPMPSARAKNRSGSFIIGREYESIESNREIRHEFELTATAEAVAIREDFNGGPSVMSATQSDYGPGSNKGDKVITYLPAWANSTAHVEVKVYNKSGVVVWSDTSTKVTASAHASGGSVSLKDILPLEDIQDVQTQTKKVYMRIPANVMVKGYKWRVYLVISGSATHGGSSYEAHTKNGKEFVPYDKSKPFVAIAKDKVAFFFGRQRQILLNYASDWLMKIIGNVLVQGTIKADILEAGEWRGSGAVLAGATFDKNGRELKSFGKYKNRKGQSSAYTVYSYNSKLYTVYHSIPHSRYVPIVQVSGETGGNGGWSLTPRVYSVSAYSFTVGIITNGDNKTRNGLSYVAYQAD